MNKSAIYSLLVLLLFSSSLSAAEWQVGVRKVDITPTEPVILAGYGSRTKPSEGIDTTLWARALAIGDEHPHLVIAVDSCGVPLEMTERIYNRITAKVKLDRAAFVICSTHTHNAPALPGYAKILWAERAGQAEAEAAQRYAKQLEDKLVELASDVLKNQVDAKLSWGQGKVTFGGNRRVLNEGKWAGFGFQSNGPVDHSLPMLVAQDSTGKVIAVWTNYACHCTTVGARNLIGGDWAGFANEEIEKNFPPTIALTTIGCGADVGPQPAGSLDLALQHGTAIAVEAKRLIESDSSLRPLTQKLQSNSAQVGLPYAAVHDLAYWQKQAELRGFDGTRGRSLLKQLKEKGKLESELPYSIATWQFGDDLAIVFLPGEVCVDYAVRLKTRHDWNRMWINGWSNDVPCYIPSKRVLHEGGYEADFSMIYYDRPSRFADTVEDRIVAAVGQLLGDRFDTRSDARDPDFFGHPAPEKITLRQFEETVANYEAEQKAIFQRIKALSLAAQNGFSELRHADFEPTVWYDFYGRRDKKRPYVRQQKSGQRVEWQTAALKTSDAETVICFSGGLGWISQHATAGFELAVGDQPAVKFDVTREIAHWSSDDQQLNLYYLPTWKSAEDSAGFFFLVIKGDRIVADGKPITLSVRSIGENSMRWFAVDQLSDTKETIRQLLEELS